MNRYTIYCTEEQTRKALGLGAPILNRKNAITRDDIPHFTEGEVSNDWTLFFIPTAEQMISWLEEQDIFVSINHIREGYSSWLKTISDNKNISENLGYVSSRKEATFAAIDAALDYLSNNKNGIF